MNIIEWFRRLREDAATWPNITIKIHVLPWHWRLRAWVDYQPAHRDPLHETVAGWASVTVYAGPIEVDLGTNLPPFVVPDDRHECFVMDGARVHGDPNMSEEAKGHLRTIIAAAKAKVAAEHDDRHRPPSNNT